MIENCLIISQGYHSLLFETIPISVVLSRNGSSQFGHKCLHFLPKMYSVEQRVHPSVDYAVACVEASLVMSGVLFIADNKP